MALTLFVTGTDTGVGKTHAAVALIHALGALGLKVGAMKPVASGCELTADGLRNDDALALIAATGRPLAYETVNPYAFAPPIAPHLAARAVGATIDTAVLDEAYRRLTADCEVLVIEGAGGWRVPLSDGASFADWVESHRWPVLLVVGLRLGCLNHAALSAESIARRVPLVGWIANRLPPEQTEWAANVETLQRLIAAPMLACLPPDATVTPGLDPNAIKALMAELETCTKACV